MNTEEEVKVKVAKVKKERTPEKIAQDKERMQKVREAKRPKA